MTSTRVTRVYVPMTGWRPLIVAACVVLAGLAAAGCGGGTSVETTVTPVTASPVASSTAVPQLLHLGGYDVTPDNFRAAIRGEFIAQDPASLCNSIKGLSGQAVLDALAVPPLPSPASAGNSTSVPGQTPNPDDANAAAQIIFDECNRVTSGAPTPATSSHAPQTVAEILVSLRAAGLPIDDTLVFDASTDANLGLPGQYTGKAYFHDSRLPTSLAGLHITSGGSIETYANAADARGRYDYLIGVSQSLPLYAEYDYLEGTALLRIAHALTPDQANAYATAFTAIVG